MKIEEQVGHQGDCQFYLIDKIPSNAVKVEKRFLAASEQSGSVHALCGEYDLYEMEDGFCIDVLKDCTLNHTFKENVKENIDKSIELPIKDHRSSTIKKGKYFVGIQRRYDPLQKLWKQVQD
jgi:hypothetical protein